MSGATFARGIHPGDFKESTEKLAVQRMPPVPLIHLLLGQHIGAPSKPTVKVGDRVRRGQQVGDPGGFVSVALHSPATGRVVAITDRRHPTGAFVPSIDIEVDAFDSQEMVTADPVDPDTLTADAFVAHTQRGGMVGMGGAAFPSHVKYKVPEGKSLTHLLLNGAECEPYLTSDHRVMLERADDVVRGVEILANALRVERSDIGVELNKADAIAALGEAVGRRPTRRPIAVRPLEVKYPQGAEKMLIQAVYARAVPAGALPLDLGVVVNNVSTMASMADWFDRGIPLFDRVVTVAGPAVARPANLLVPIGTPIRAVLEHCGVDLSRPLQVVSGGPMMGLPVVSLDAPVLKGTSGLLAFYEAELPHDPAGPCIRCGRCLEACALNLNPSLYGRLARAGYLEDLEPHYVMDCMECGACTWACPSSIPLVQLIRSSKAAIRSKKAKERKG